MANLGPELQERVRAACAAGQPLRISGGGTKDFLSPACEGAVLDVSGHTGLIDYAPSELVLTARAGTPLKEIESILAQHGQMLGFEPPHFGAGATLGGTLACALSGPRRPYAGAARDFVLGMHILNGRGELLGFGGQVMKNVAGFDVSRLMVGARGTLGVILDVSLKVLPLPAEERTLRVACGQEDAIALMAGWAGKPLPVSATAWIDGALMVRLSGLSQAVEAMTQQVISEPVSGGQAFWQGLREQTLPFFALQPDESLWRISLPPGSPPLALSGRTCLDWGGAQRWLVTAQPPESVASAAHQAGGAVTRYRGSGDVPVANISPALLGLHQRIKRAFDPAGILNPGREFGVRS